LVENGGAVFAEFIRREREGRVGRGRGRLGAVGGRWVGPADLPPFLAFLSAHCFSFLNNKQFRYKNWVFFMPEYNNVFYVNVIQE
jgi:hypothetical protein